MCRLYFLVSDPDLMFQASLSCGRLLLGGPGGVVMEMLQYNRTLMAMATLMYAPVPIEEVSQSLPLPLTPSKDLFLPLKNEIRVGSTYV